VQTLVIVPVTQQGDNLLVRGNQVKAREKRQLNMPGA
jgi:hypothetical protein